MRFTAAVSQEGAWHVARCLEVEVTSQGESFDDALANLREALELYFEDQSLPEGIEAPIIAPVDIPAWAQRSRIVSGKETIRVLKKLGFAEVSQKGSHVRLRNDEGRTVIVPLHRELARGTLASVLRQAGLSADQFREALWRLADHSAWRVPSDLVDRESEWTDLVSFAEGLQPQLRVGRLRRRRFGKSFLLRRLVEREGGLYYLALDEAREPALRRFAGEVGQLLRRQPGSLSRVGRSPYGKVWMCLGSRDTPQVLVVDEYPYLRAQSAELDSVLRAQSDSAANGELGKDWQSSVSVVLCGSALSVMTELLSGTSPLRGPRFLSALLDHEDAEDVTDGLWAAASRV